MTKLEDLIAEHMKEGSSVQVLARALLDCGLYTEYQEAYNVAQYELLLAHTKLSHESIMSNQAVTQKVWRYTGEKNNNSVHCRNHASLDNTIVPKDEPFKLVGLDGKTYYPMFPRDPVLPHEERVKCVCMMQGSTGSSMMERYYEEKKQNLKAGNSDNVIPMDGYRLLDELSVLIEKLEDEHCADVEEEILSVFKVVLNIEKLSPYQTSIALKRLADCYYENDCKEKALKKYRLAVEKNPKLPVKRRIKELGGAK